LDHLDRHPALDGFGLLGHPDRAHAAFADLLEELVGADDGAGGFSERFSDRGDRPDRSVQNAAAVEMGMKQALDLMPQIRILPTGLLDKGPSFVRRFDVDRRTKDRVDAWLVAHRTSLPIK